jgi:hypothetical protein
MSGKPLLTAIGQILQSLLQLPCKQHSYTPTLRKRLRTFIKPGNYVSVIVFFAREKNSQRLISFFSPISYPQPHPSSAGSRG